MFCFLHRSVCHGRQRITASDNDPSMFLSTLCYSLRFMSTESFTVSYLITKLGVSPESASKASNYVHFKTPKKPDSVISFLQKFGFSKPQFKTLVNKAPRLLASDVEKTLLPKLEFLRSKGFSSPDLVHFLSANPSILQRSLEKQIIPFFNSFSNLIHSDEKTVKVIKRYPILISYDIDAYVIPNIKILRDHGVPESIIVKVLQNYPRCFVVHPTRFKQIVKEVKEMGCNPLKMQFVHAVSVRRQKKSVWGRKFDVYMKWGWSDQYFWEAFRKYPCCMEASEEKIEAIMEFLVNKMEFQSLLIAKQSSVIGRSLERRIVPRGLFVRDLLSEGLIDKFTLSGLFDTSEKVFLGRFVNQFEDKAAELLKLYKEKLDLAVGGKYRTKHSKN